MLSPRCAPFHLHPGIAMRTIAWTGVLAASVLGTITSKAVAGETDSLQAFTQAYRCQIVDRLERIYSHGVPGKSSNLYLTVELPITCTDMCNAYSTIAELNCSAKLRRGSISTSLEEHGRSPSVLTSFPPSQLSAFPLMIHTATIRCSSTCLSRPPCMGSPISC